MSHKIFRSYKKEKGPRMGCVGSFDLLNFDHRSMVGPEGYEYEQYSRRKTNEIAYDTIALIMQECLYGSTLLIQREKIMSTRLRTDLAMFKAL